MAYVVSCRRFLMVERSIGCLITFLYVGNCFKFTGSKNGQESSWTCKLNGEFSLNVSHTIVCLEAHLHFLENNFANCQLFHQLLCCLLLSFHLFFVLVLVLVLFGHWMNHVIRVVLLDIVLIIARHNFAVV